MIFTKQNKINGIDNISEVWINNYGHVISSSPSKMIIIMQSNSVGDSQSGRVLNYIKYTFVLLNLRRVVKYASYVQCICHLHTSRHSDILPVEVRCYNTLTCEDDVFA